MRIKRNGESGGERGRERGVKGWKRVGLRVSNVVGVCLCTECAIPFFIEASLYYCNRRLYVDLKSNLLLTMQKNDRFKYKTLDCLL